MNVKIAAAISPGRASGSTTCQTARPRPAPSTRAASSSSSGIDSKNARRSQRQNGRQKVVYERTRARRVFTMRSEEHTSELQSHSDLVCRLLLEKKKKRIRSQRT